MLTLSLFLKYFQTSASPLLLKCACDRRRKPPCKVSHISTHHPAPPDSTNDTALSPLPAHSGFHLSFHTAWPTLKHCSPSSRALQPVKFSVQWCSAVCVFVYLLDSSLHWTCCVRPRPRLPSGHLACDYIVSSFSALAILYFFPSSQQQTSCFGEVSALCPSSSPLQCSLPTQTAVLRLSVSLVVSLATVYPSAALISWAFGQKAEWVELIQDPPQAGKAHFLSRRQKWKFTAAARADMLSHYPTLWLAGPVQADVRWIKQAALGLATSGSHDAMTAATQKCVRVCVCVSTHVRQTERDHAGNIWGN